MIARGASIDIDGVYSNPAGLSFLSHEGFYLSLTGQSAYKPGGPVRDGFYAHKRREEGR
jgi:hypothetical protein